MRNLVVLAIALAVLVDPSCQLSRHEVLSKFVGERRSGGKREAKQWTPSSISSEYTWRLNQYAQDGLQENDKITALPGQPAGITFAQYGGYVTVDAEAGRALFYYFAEAAQDPSTKPLLLWLNGCIHQPEPVFRLFLYRSKLCQQFNFSLSGPGCSSFGVGAMTELGPFRVQSDGKTLSNNPYAWNQVANTLFLESPAGVGFSYSNTTSDYQNGNDDNTAQDAYTFLLNWFERFPQYKNRDFYIAGESYAGFYVPELADTILKNNNSRTSFINLKGVMIGNGIMNDETDHCGRTDYWWTHALMSDEDYANKRCTMSSLSYTTHSNTFSSQAESTMGEIDPYNIYAPLCPSQIDPLSASSTSIDEYPTNGLDGFDPCSSDYVFIYLNTPKVQIALHANVTNLHYAWSECSDVLSYKTNATTMFPVYQRMMAAGLRILVYSGDVDGVVPVTGTRYSINALKLPIEEAWYPWMNGELDVGGYSVIYKGLTFATVRGAGHEVPSYQPSRALTMTKSFLAGKPLPS